MLFPHFLKLYLNSIKTISKLYFFWTVYRESNTSNFFPTIFFRRLKNKKGKNIFFSAFFSGKINRKNGKREKHFFYFFFFSQKSKKQKMKKNLKKIVRKKIEKFTKKLKINLKIKLWDLRTKKYEKSELKRAAIYTSKPF